MANWGSLFSGIRNLATLEEIIGYLTGIDLDSTSIKCSSHNLVDNV